jgi:Helicase conserved C-terminal domain
VNGTVTLADYLEAKRVSELQEFHSFWGNGDPAPSRKPELKASLLRLMNDEETMAKKLRVLSQTPTQLLLILIRSDDFRADIQSVFYNDHGIQLEYYEVEAAARALSRRGFIEISRDRSWINYGKEVYTVPREVGDVVSLLLSEERRGPREVFTLGGHLSGLSAQKMRGMMKRLGFEGNGELTPDRVARFLVEEKGTGALLDSISQSRLRAMFIRLIEEYGGVISRTRYEKEFKNRVKWERKRWQKFVEGAGLGTMSNISLEPYGIHLEGESVVVFRDLVEQYFREVPPDPESFDNVSTCRIDFLTDMAYFLRYAARNPVRVTQAKSLYKAAHARIREGMVFKDEVLADRDLALGLIWDLTVGLKLVEIGEDRLLKVTPEGEAWEGLELAEQVQQVFDQLLEERVPEGRDFHLRKIRRILSQHLRQTGRNSWRHFLELPFVARNEYLAALEDDGIRERYKNRFQYTYDPPKVSVPGLVAELRDWIIGRLYVLGIVEIGSLGDEPVALRLTELGLKGLGVAVEEREGNGMLPLVVNPDFEVLVFPEGDVLEVVHTLDRFAVRTKSEEVSHYRILKEGVERAVVKGMDAEGILEFLTSQSRTPIPQNVEYSIRNWGEKIRFGTQQEVVLLKVDSEEVLDRILAIDRIRDVMVERISPTAAALSEPIENWRTLEELRGLGVYLRD